MGAMNQLGVLQRHFSLF